MSEDDFNDFFEIEDKEEKKEDPKPQSGKPASLKPEAAPPPALPKAPSPPKPQPGPATPPQQTLDDRLLSDLGDFDKLFDLADEAAEAPTKKVQAPGEPVKEEPSVENILAEFHLDEKAPAAPEIPAPKVMPQPKPPVPPAPTAPPNTDDLLEEFLSSDQPHTKPPEAQPVSSPEAGQPRPGAQDTVQPSVERSKRDEALEDLFSEVSGAGVSVPQETGDALASGLGIEYRERAKVIPRVARIAVPSAVATLILVVLAMARFTPGGFFGWTVGQTPKDGYVAPSADVAKQLNEAYQSTLPLFSTDRVEDYRKAETEYEAILKMDARNSPTDARLAETLLLIGDKTVGSNVRKRIISLVDQSEKYHPSLIETLRAKARYLFTDGQYAQAETTARRALSMDSKDPGTLTLLGEIALSRGDLDAAVTQFGQVLASNPKWPRAQHFLAVAYLQQGNIEEAERILRQLVSAQPTHPSSQIDLWRLLYSNRGQVNEAKEGLKTLVQTGAATLSNYDLGRAWKSLAEIAEAQNDLPGAVAAMEKAAEADRSSHANAFYLGRLYLQQKQYEKAATEFGRASSLSPQTAEYFIYEGNALREMGKFAESFGQLNKGLEKEALNVEGLYQLGLTQRALNRSDEAVASFENVLKADPRHLNAMVNLGELYLARDNFSMARTQLKAAIAIAPNSVRAHDAMGEVLLVNRRFAEALGEFQIAEKQAGADVDVLLNLGRAYLALNRTDKASSYFQKALAAEPNRLDTQVAIGELERRKKEYTKALETFRNVLKARPRDYDTWVRAATVLIDEHSYQEALADLQEASKWNSNYFPTHLNLGIAWRGLGNLEAAGEQLSIASQLRPESAEAYYQIQVTHIFRNDPGNAGAAMEKALSFDPKYVEPLVAMGDFYDERGQYGKAVEYYLRAERIDPADGEILLKIAEAFRRDEKTKAAKTYFEKTLAVTRNSSDAYVGLAQIAEEAGGRRLAIDHLRKAQAIDPDDPRPYYYLGFMYKDTNQRQAAVLAFRKYLKLDPNSKEKEDIEDQIDSLTRTP
ncbi:MAG: tetratricopeptide repeat protein [Pseudomonadota bacterium]